MTSPCQLNLYKCAFASLLNCGFAANICLAKWTLREVSAAVGQIISYDVVHVVIANVEAKGLSDKTIAAGVAKI